METLIRGHLQQEEFFFFQKEPNYALKYDSDNQLKVSTRNWKNY